MHRPISAQSLLVAGHFSLHVDKKAGQRKHIMFVLAVARAQYSKRGIR